MKIALLSLILIASTSNAATTTVCTSNIAGETSTLTIVSNNGMPTSLQIILEGMDSSNSTDFTYDKTQLKYASGRRIKAEKPGVSSVSLEIAEVDDQKKISVARLDWKYSLVDHNTHTNWYVCQ